MAALQGGRDTLSAMSPQEVDVIILGGGVAGLWTLDQLTRRGYCSLLLEAEALGSGQTVASQGIIHGGLKYTLSGLFTAAAESIRDMPAIWRSCLAGIHPDGPDLSSTKLRADHCHLWRNDSIRSRLGMIGAKVGLRVAPETISIPARPAVLRDVAGETAVTRLDEQVIDVVSMLADLALQHRDRLLRIDATQGVHFEFSSMPDALKERRLDSGTSSSSPSTPITVVLSEPRHRTPLSIRTRCIILTAGEGNAHLRERLGLSAQAMQRRPLHMVMLKGQLPTLNGHCVDAASTRITVTTARHRDGTNVWQVGGRIAEENIDRDPLDLCRFARREIEACIPGVSLSGTQWSTYKVNRAEAGSAAARRPDDAVALVRGNVITAWPTKLALAPRLASIIVQHLDGVIAPIERISSTRSDRPRFDLSAISNWPRPDIALPPWETAETWFTDV